MDSILAFGNSDLVMMIGFIESSCFCGLLGLITFMCYLFQFWMMNKSFTYKYIILRFQNTIVDDEQVTYIFTIPRVQNLSQFIYVNIIWLCFTYLFLQIYTPAENGSVTDYNIKMKIERRKTQRFLAFWSKQKSECHWSNWCDIMVNKGSDPTISIWWTPYLHTNKVSKVLVSLTNFLSPVNNLDLAKIWTNNLDIESNNNEISHRNLHICLLYFVGFYLKSVTCMMHAASCMHAYLTTTKSRENCFLSKNDNTMLH